MDELDSVSETRPYRVLVVCTGNTCRTPMAVAILRERLSDTDIPAEVRSAGTQALDGAPAHFEAQAVARAAGLDLTDHRSQPLTPDLVRWADIVLGMSRRHVVAAREMDDAADVRLLTEFDPAGAHDGGIVDPIGHSRDVYASVFDKLCDCLDTFVEAHRSGATG